MTRLPRFVALCAAALAGACSLPPANPPFVPTPMPVVEEMLRMADAGPGDVVYDLGSGDGRIPVAAVRDFGVKRAVGVDIDPDRVADGMEAAHLARVGDRTEFVQGDVFAFDFSAATVVTMYLLPHVNLKLRPRILSDLRPGTRVVSHRFDMGEWRPDAEATVDGNRAYLWIVPAQAAGTWRWSAGGEPFGMSLEQQFQQLSGTLHAFGREVPIEHATLRGDRLTVETRIEEGERRVPVRLTGRVDGNSFAGEFQVGGRTTEIAARRVE